ncbi:protein WHAT'S THIS FACTOR 9, mitochondrial [Alnus glutinosa]|uniref:protein WHAT'S THIS FACTOR 9, mitochondrial n=1 Tax=Alnus glutinosa TaxID=3517 RepID=UPI002D776FEA|nr:protein WHAT'S THIS FACTOR 9, mitochondrial [Alnus glutinosa]XP_062159984.1 protein WHAT'S THIS FACTOR 9, mitochondrial [Alnus glutinosa]
MQFIFRSLPKPISHSQSQLLRHGRTFLDDAATIKWVRDRGLDHVVEKEKNLRPVLNLKNFIKSEPSKSVPISVISQNRDSLQIPIRPIDFVRRYPSVFEEFLPGGIRIHPHVRLTPEVLNLDAEEQLVYQSETYKQQAADRVLKLLMISRANRIPLSIIELLKWDLGLPQDYEKTIVPEFPDYFRIVGHRDSAKGSEDTRALELVCWSNELATSVMEKKAMNGKLGYEKGMALAFPTQFSRGFEMDKKLKKWVDEWQKLPYISPYENASHLPPKSDESEKWAVAVLHELLHILVPKKTERDNILCLGECLGLRSRFKRALLHDSGIFYLSSKIGTYTVVLREGYKRGLLVEDHPWMRMRNQYIHLMNMVKENSKPVSVPGASTQKKKQIGHDEKGKGEEEEDIESGEEHEGGLYDSSDAEVEEASDNKYEHEDENESHRGVRRNVADNRGSKARKMNFDAKVPSRKFERKRVGVEEASDNRYEHEDENESHRGVRRNVADNRGSKAREMNFDAKGPSRKFDRKRVGVEEASDNRYEHEDENESHRGVRRNFADNRGSKGRKMNFDVKGPLRKFERKSAGGKQPGKTKEKFQSKVSKREKMHGGNNVGGSSQERSSLPKSRGRSLPDKRISTS